jgi:hypothetical protein
MTSTDLHPEDLLDREMRGDISPEERERLLAHMRQCAVCRLERLARDDFQREFDGAETDADAQRLVASLVAPVAQRRARAGLGGALRLSMRQARWALVAAAIVSVAGWAAASRWPGVRWATSAKLPASETTRRSSNATGLAPVGRGKAQVGSSPSATESAPSLPAPSVPSVPATQSPTATFAPLADVPASPPIDSKGESAGALPARRPVRALQPPVRPVPARGGTVFSAPARVASIPPEPLIRAMLPPDAPALFGRANEARRLGDHASEAHYYRALIEDYPASSEAHDALAVLGRMLLDDTDAEGALRCFDEYLRLGGALREDVMLGRALCLRRLGRAGDETRALEALVAAYPRSVHAERARRRLLDLGGP